MHPPPPPPEKKKFCSEKSKRKESSAQVCWQEGMYVPFRYDKIKTKKVGKKEGKFKRKGIKLKKRKREDSRLLEVEIIKQFFHVYLPLLSFWK